MYTEDFARKKRLTYLGGCLRYYDCSIFNYMHTNVSRCFQLSLFRFSIVCLVYMLSANLRISMFNIADTTKTGAAEQVKPVKPGLHQNSEVLVETFLTSWIYEGGIFLCFTRKKLVPTPLYIIFCTT